MKKLGSNLQTSTLNAILQRLSALESYSSKHLAIFGCKISRKVIYLANNARTPQQTWWMDFLESNMSRIRNKPVKGASYKQIYYYCGNRELPLMHVEPQNVASCMFLRSVKFIGQFWKRFSCCYTHKSTKEDCCGCFHYLK